MRDRLGTAQVWNWPVRNETQNVYRRFVRSPQAGLPDMLANYKKAWDDMTAKTIRPRIEEM